MKSIPEKIKRELFNLLKKQTNAFGTVGGPYDGILDFLSEIWNLRSMPSTDSRFSDAYEDIVQHTINNSDWDDDFLFIDRLNLLKSDSTFNSFLETIVAPKYRNGEMDILKFVLLIDPYLSRFGGTMAVVEYLADGNPVYKIRDKGEGEDFLPDIKKNDIPFFVVMPSGRSDRLSFHHPPTVFPAFILAFNDGWNDYHIKSSFSLFYYNEERVPVYIGEIKIISDGEEIDTNEIISKQFTVLSDSYCSLGQSLDYYTKLRKACKKNFDSVLLALRDAAYYADVHDKFERNYKFKQSVIRSDSTERLLRTARYQVAGYDLDNLYSFTYQFRPPYATDPVEARFEFSSVSILPNRIYAIIGKNGTGKTQLITSLPNNISKKQENHFFPKLPLFSKVIAVSYSVFDQFEIPAKTASFNYVYCGIRNSKEEEISEKGLLLRFHNSWKKIHAMERMNQWRKILLNFIDSTILDYFIMPNGESTINGFTVDIEGFHVAKAMLSSGQSIILYIITQIVANIRYDSLLLYDEPETHLHPNAITELMNTIYELVNEFQSYCIIATHSPLIVRELFSKNVYVLERHEQVASIRRIGIESFGENTSVITDDVFGNKNVQKQYKKIIEDLMFPKRSFDDIVQLLESDNVPLSLNTRLYIRNLIKEQNDQP